MAKTVNMRVDTRGINNSTKVRYVLGSAIVSEEDLDARADRRGFWAYTNYQGSPCPCNGC